MFELQKIEKQEKAASQENEKKILHSWSELETRIRSNPTLHSKFATLQNKFLKSEEIKNYPPDFVSGVLALNLQESEV